MHPYWAVFFDGLAVAGALVLVAWAWSRRAARRASFRRRGGWFTLGWRCDLEPESVRLEVRPPRLLVAFAALPLALAWWTLARPALAPVLGRLPLPAASRAVLHEPTLLRARVVGVVGLVVGVYALGASRRRALVVLEARGDLRWERRGVFTSAAGQVPPELFLGFEVDPVEGRVFLAHGDPEAPATHDLFVPDEPDIDELVADLQDVTDAFAELIQRRSSAI